MQWQEIIAMAQNLAASPPSDDLHQVLLRSADGAVQPDGGGRPGFHHGCETAFKQHEAEEDHPAKETAA